MRNKAFVLEFVLTAALFAATPTSATSIPFCKDYGTASPRPNPTGAGEIAVAAPRSHGGAVIKAENISIRYITGDIKNIGFKEYVMKKIKGEAKKRNIPVVCAKRSVSCVFCEYCKVFGLDKQFGCQNA